LLLSIDLEPETVKALRYGEMARNAQFDTDHPHLAGLED
jgi:hypothetical protein